MEVVLDPVAWRGDAPVSLHWAEPLNKTVAAARARPCSPDICVVMNLHSPVLAGNHARNVVEAREDMRMAVFGTVHVPSWLASSAHAAQKECRKPRSSPLADCP